jgi:hypothetical protein
MKSGIDIKKHPKRDTRVEDQRMFPTLASLF